jgi:alpha-beta hydrolase superfamily lysophospholipase
VWIFAPAGLLIVILCTIAAIQHHTLRSFENAALNPGFRATANPGDIGLKYDPLMIPSGSRQLAAFAVKAGAQCPRTAAVLIFHGRGETVADWISVQRLLHDRCISSVVFDYSGHGRSSPAGTVANLDADAVAADTVFASLFPAQRRCLLSHSLGAGPMLYAATHARVSANCIVISSPFSSLRSMAVLGGLRSEFRFLLPDVWDNVEVAAHVRIPMLWLHSTTDATIPLALGRAVYDAKPGDKTAVAVSGFGHNAIYTQMPMAIWGPITDFLLDDKESSAG